MDLAIWYFREVNGIRFREKKVLLCVNVTDGKLEEKLSEI